MPYNTSPLPINYLIVVTGLFLIDILYLRQAKVYSDIFLPEVILQASSKTAEHSNYGQSVCDQSRL